MPELPEITCRAREMNAALAGKTITAIEILQPKCLNVPPESFTESLCGAQVRQTSQRGKWLLTETARGWLLINLGMGGELLLVTRATLPEKYRLIFDFDDATCLAVNFWWFGSAHFVPPGQLNSHGLTAKLGPDALTLTAADLRATIHGRRGQLKAFLLDQSKIAGIGNAYIHDILLLARLHPLRPLNSLTGAEIDALAAAIRQGLQPAIDKGGAFYELNLYGHKGGFTLADILFAQGQCPFCQTPIEKIKTGSTSSHICPRCQPLNQ
jgi:formamidopyrimidine-DNA glycosylase